MTGGMASLRDRLAGGGRFRQGAVAALAGAVLALGQAPFDLPLLGFLAWPVLIWLLGTADRAAWLGWCAGVGFFGLTLTWIVEPFLVDIARHGALAPAALIGLAGGLALFWMLGFWLARRVGRDGIALVVALAVGLSLAEYARATVLTGFPWALAAYGWVDTPVAQAASVVGPHALGALLILLMGLPAALTWRATAAGLLGIAVLWGAGAWRLMTPSDLTPVRVRLVQPNAPQHLKWQRDHIPIFLDRAMRATAAAGDRDVVIWPETAYPARLGTRPDIEADIAAQAGGARVVMGAIRSDFDAGMVFNSVAVLNPSGQIEAVYDKHHLVPFGEYIPLADLLYGVGLGGLAGLAGGMSAGPQAQRIDLPGLPAFQPLICYEAIFPHEILRGPERPDWLIQATNDAWFGTWSGPYQHLAQARMRAIEQGLPLARAANTGVSAMIDAKGRVTASLGLGRDGFVDAPLPRALAPTPYARFGDLPMVILLLTLLVGLALRRGRA